MHDYLAAAMATARFDELSSGGWFGAVPRFHVVIATGTTREECYAALQSDLAGAVREALRHNRPLPELAGVATPGAEQLS